MEEDYYHTKTSVKEYIAAAEGIDGSEHINRLKEFLPMGSKVLELGTGPGKDWVILQNSYSVLGSDYSKEFLTYLSATYPEGRFIELDAATLNLDDQFNGVYSNKVLHHLKDSELRASIKRQCELLEPEGVVCHSFWKGEGSEVFKGLFVNYHTAFELKELFGIHYEILLLESYAEFEDGDSILLIAKKKA